MQPGDLIFYSAVYNVHKKMILVLDVHVNNRILVRLDMPITWFMLRSIWDRLHPLEQDGKRALFQYFLLTFSIRLLIIRSSIISKVLSLGLKAFAEVGVRNMNGKMIEEKNGQEKNIQYLLKRIRQRVLNLTK
jgi:hypothetical protein